MDRDGGGPGKQQVLLLLLFLGWEGKALNASVLRARCTSRWKCLKVRRLGDAEGPCTLEGCLSSVPLAVFKAAGSTDCTWEEVGMCFLPPRSPVETALVNTLQLTTLPHVPPLATKDWLVDKSEGSEGGWIW